MLRHAIAQVVGWWGVVMPPTLPDPDKDRLAMESEEDLRAKLRHFRTALAHLQKACDRDGLFHDEMAAVAEAVAALTIAADAALESKRNGD